MRAQSKDHIPPLSWIYALGSDYFFRAGLLVVWVPSCKECNVALGHKKLFTIRERTLYLVGYYTKRYEPFLHGEAWNDQEIDELKGNLKKDISHYADLQRVVDRRLAILEENAQMRSLRQAV